MKTLRWTILVVIVMFFIVGLGFMAWSGVTMSPNVPKLMGCPDGWYVKPNTSAGTFRCLPNEPPMSCLDGWEKYWDGCMVGCNQIPGKPR